MFSPPSDENHFNIGGAESNVGYSDHHSDVNESKSYQ